MTLTACGTDAFEESNDKNSLNVENNNITNDGLGNNVPFTSAPGYISPFEINAAKVNTPIFYKFTNWTGDWASPHLLTLRVTPYVGLAYFDGLNDGDYDGTPLDPVNYPNLYSTLGGNEVGHFIPAVPFIMDGSGLPYPGTSELDVLSSAEHCPIIPNTSGPLNPGAAPIFFDVSPVVGNGTPEAVLIGKYGKVFFYYLEAINPVTNLVVWSKYMMPDCTPAVPPGIWNGPVFSVNVPGIVPAFPLYWHPGSNELVLNIKSVYPSPNPPQYGSVYQFPFNGYTIQAEVKTDADGMYVTLNDL